MASALEPRAGMAVAGVFLGGLGIAGAVALVTAPISPHLAVRTPALAASAAPPVRAEAAPSGPPRLFD